MSYLIIELACQSCSFRNPEFQNFHKTFELPPPTTIIGFGGAALGLSPKEAQDFFDESFEFGVSGTHNGKALDLWKYRKLKLKEFITDILTREVLFENHIFLVFGTPENKKLNKLRESIENPVYALTLGNSDGLAKVVQTSILSDSITIDSLKNCIVEGNVMKEVLSAPSGLEYALRDGEDPMSYDLPVAFSYESDYGIRRVVRRKEFSFIGSDLSVNGLSKKGVIFGDKQIPLFDINA